MKRHFGSRSYLVTATHQPGVFFSLSVPSINYTRLRRPPLESALSVCVLQPMWGPLGRFWLPMGGPLGGPLGLLWLPTGGFLGLSD